MEESGHFALALYRALRTLVSEGFFALLGAPLAVLGKSYTDSVTSCHLLPVTPKSRGAGSPLPSRGFEVEEQSPSLGETVYILSSLAVSEIQGSRKELSSESQPQQLVLKSLAQARDTVGHTRCP